MKASDIIELVGSEISWELSNTDGRWYVWASHSSGDAETSCKFSDGDDDLTACVRRVANEVLAWQQEQGWPKTAKGKRCIHPWHSNPALIFPCPECGEGSESAESPWCERCQRAKLDPACEHYRTESEKGNG